MAKDSAKENTTKLNLHQKLVEIRKQALYFQKYKPTDKTPYEYVQGSDILATIRPKMDELNVLLVSSVENYEYSREWLDKVDTKWENGKKIDLPPKKVPKETVILKMKMVWIDGDNPEDEIHIPFVAFGTNEDPSKALGSALTYSERYFLLKFFNVPTDKDDPDRFADKHDYDTVPMEESAPPIKTPLRTTNAAEPIKIQVKVNPKIEPVPTTPSLSPLRLFQQTCDPNAIMPAVHSSYLQKAAKDKNKDVAYMINLVQSKGVTKSSELTNEQFFEIMDELEAL